MAPLGVEATLAAVGGRFRAPGGASGSANR